MLGLTALNGVFLSVWGRTFLDVVVCDAAETAAPDTAPHCLSFLSLTFGHLKRSFGKCGDQEKEKRKKAQSPTFLLLCLVPKTDPLPSALCNSITGPIWKMAFL